MPVYNVSEYIERCIHSVMNQTFSDFECILVDDASPDDSIEKCEQLISEYTGKIRFKIIHHEYNRGLSAARNTGTEAAIGDYILYIDSDDTITPDCIEKLMAPIMRDNTIEMVIGGYELHAVGVPLPKNPRKHKCGDYATLQNVRHCFYDDKGVSDYAWNRLVRRDFLERHNITFKEGLLWEDDLWWFYVMKHLKHLCVIPDITYQYNRHSGSLTLGTDLKTKQHHWGVIFDEISNNFTIGDSRREAKHYLKWFCSNYIDCSDDELYKMAARNFMKQLSFLHDSKECMLLLITGLLSKTELGCKGYHCMHKMYKAVRGF